MPSTEACPAYQILVIAKEPIPGRVKTRLCPPFSPATAAELAMASLRDTLAAALSSQAQRVVLLLDGQAGDWVPEQVDVIPQAGGGLDRRLAAGFQSAWQACQLPMLLIGMDTPQVTAPLLDTCAARLAAVGTDCVLGPAHDGGWWALGLRQPDEMLLHDVEMSTPSTGAAQLKRLQEFGLAVTLLEWLIDVDDAADAYDVAAANPDTRFAHALNALVGVA